MEQNYILKCVTVVRLYNSIIVDNCAINNLQIRLQFELKFLKHRFGLSSYGHEQKILNKLFSMFLALFVAYHDQHSFRKTLLNDLIHFFFPYTVRDVEASLSCS